MNLSKHILFIVNPFAGKGKALSVANHALEVLNKNGIKTTLFISQSKGDISNITSKYNSNDFTSVAVLGGDGTMHEVLNAVMENESWLKLSYLLFPCGTGNAFNYDLDCLTSDKAIDLLLNGKDTLIDIAEVKTNAGSIWSFNIVGCGLVAHINVLAEKMRWLGSARYTVASLIKILSNPTIKAKVIANGKEVNAEFCFLFACNTRYTGKAMKMAPMASLNDGKIDLLIVKKASRLTLLGLFSKVFSGKHMDSHLLQYVQTSHLKIETEIPEIVNIDGEIKGNTSLEILMHPKKLKIISQA
ncbi:MAG: YegS/Rv2252/BmrU family lipid kinase [Bacteroidetes bacterium]|nr:YegS/Rv2252/BmrU family lipid kinase [Bacteroidota bacterium]